MDAARALIIFCFVLLGKIDGCLSASIKVEEDQDELDVVTGKEFFILKDRTTNSCLDIPWGNFEKAIDEFRGLKTYPECHGRSNQLFKFSHGHMESYQESCLCLGARKLGDREPVGLVPVGDENQLNWTLDGNVLHVTNTTFWLGMSGNKVILKQGDRDNSTLRLEEVSTLSVLFLQRRGLTM